MTIHCQLALPLDGSKDLTLIATPEECTEIAAQLGVESVARVEAKVHLQQHKHHLHCVGTLSAQWQDDCVISAKPLDLNIEEALDLRLRWDVEMNDLAPEDDLIERDDAGCIDFGALMIEYVSLHMPDYPRHPDSAELDVAALGDILPEGTPTAGTAMPFAGLGDLLKG